MKPEFQLFGGDHWAALVAVAGSSWLAYRLASGSQSELWRRLGGTLLGALAAALWLFRLVDGFQADLDLPLALCDLAFLLSVACFFWPRAWALVMVTYWGLAGTLQALITPDLLYGFPSKEYFLFFIGHSVVIVAVFFLLGKNRQLSLSGWRRAREAFGGLLLYTAVVGGLDALFGWNYGYLRAKPEGSSVLDFMGPWPWYILGALAFAAFLFVIVAGLLSLMPKPRE